MINIPNLVALALQADGWWIRSDIIWHKPNPMPESVTDRPTKAHEYLFLLSKSERYYYDADAIKEPAKYNGLTGQDESGYKDAQKFHGKHGRPDKQRGHSRPHAGFNDKWDGMTYKEQCSGMRNKRTVWTIATEPFTGWLKTYHLHRVMLDAVSCGMIHIPFPSCPMHGGLLDQLAKEFCGEHPRIDHSALPPHNLRTDDCLFQGQANDSEPIDQHPDNYSVPQNSGSLGHKHSVFAIDHNNQIHKRDPALETSLSCRPFVERLLHIADKSEQLAFFVHHANMSGNSILPDVMDVRLRDRIPHRIVDKSSLPFPHNCVCAIYERKAKETSHFATFPTKLVNPCILAGTSEKGQCPECGKPWVRVTETLDTKGRLGVGYHDHTDDLGRGQRGVPPGEGAPVIKTLGWRPSCECGGEPVPQIVLDPFCGKGTTAKRAKELGRDFLTCDLNPDYCAIAVQELAQTELF